MRNRLVQFFYLLPLHVGSAMMVLEVLDWHKHDRARLGLGRLKSGNANQMWCFVPVGNGFYQIMNKNSLSVLDDAECCRYPGCPVYQFGPHGGANQHFLIKNAGDNLIRLLAKNNTNLALDVSEQRTDRDAPMVLWHDWKGPNQTWRLIPA